MLYSNTSFVTISDFVTTEYLLKDFEIVQYIFIMVIQLLVVHHVCIQTIKAGNVIIYMKTIKYVLNHKKSRMYTIIQINNKCLIQL